MEPEIPSRESSSPPPRRLSVREQAIADKLRGFDLHLAGLFEQGLNLADRHSESGVPFLLAHAGRELSNGVVRILSGNSVAFREDRNVELPKDETHRKTLAQALQLPADHPIVTFWFKTHSVLESSAHFQQPGPSPAKVRSAFHHLEELLFGRLAPYFDTQRELDSLLAIEQPSGEDIERLKRYLVRPIQRLYFFRNLAHPGWLPRLAEAGFFLRPPDMESDPSTGDVRIPAWPEGEYLVKVAPAEPDLVKNVLLSISPKNSNPVVWDAIVRAALTLPPSHASQLVSPIADALSRTNPLFFVRHVITLIQTLAAAGYAEAFHLLEYLLFVAGPPTAESPDAIQARSRLKGRRETQWMLPRLDLYDLSDFIKSTLPPLEELDADRTLSLIVCKLERAVRTGEAVSPSTGDSYIDHTLWCRRLDELEESGDVRAQMAYAASGVAVRLAPRDQETAERVVQMIERYSHGIFTRIRFHIIAAAGHYLRSRLDGFVVSREAIEPSGLNARDVALVLRSQFHNASPEAQLAFRTALERGPDISKEAKAHDQETDPESAEESRSAYVARWKRRRLLWFRDRIPPLLQSIAAEVGVDGKVPSPRDQALAEECFFSGGAEWISPSSPKTPEEMFALSNNELTEFLRTWMPDPERFGIGPDLSGLKDALKEFCAIHTERAVELADRFVDGSFRGVVTEPDLAQAVIGGLVKAMESGRVIPWDRTLNLLGWIVTEIDPAVGVPSEPLSSEAKRWHITGSEAAVLIREGCLKEIIPLSNLDAVWSLLAKALHSRAIWRSFKEAYTSGTAISFGEILSDSINAYAGRATEALFAIARWTYFSTLKNLDARDQPAGERNPEAETAAKAAAGGRLIPLIEHILVQSGISGLAAQAMVGRHIPLVHFLDNEWLIRNATRLFEGGAEDPAKRPIWGSNIIFGGFYDSVFRDLRLWYLTAAQSVLSGGRAETEWSLTEHLADHVTGAFIRGILALGEPERLLENVYERVPVKDRTRMYWNIFRGWSDAPTSPPPALIDNLIRFWEWRLEVLETAPPTAERAEELKGLTWLLRVPYVPDGDIVRLGRRTIALSEGEIEVHGIIWERLAELSVVDPDATFEMAERIVQAILRNPYPHVSLEETAPIFRAAISSRSLTTRDLAKRLIHSLGEHGFFEFKSLLPDDD